MKATLVFLTILSLALLAAGCGRSTDGDEPLDPLTHPAFLTPVAEGRGEGITAYWMGEGFRAGSLAFGLNAKAQVFDRYGKGPGLDLEYGAGIEGGRVVFDLQTYPAMGRTIPAIREEVLSIPGATSQEVRVGRWDGELLISGSSGRPINVVRLFVDAGDAVAVARAGSGSTGVPGTDLNPLIDADLLIDVVAQNLRPYPE